MSQALSCSCGIVIILLQNTMSHPFDDEWYGNEQANKVAEESRYQNQ